MDNELKAKIKDSMMEYLTKVGWPNIPHEEIIHKHLQGMWKKLQDEGLTDSIEEKGFGYKAFVDSALTAKSRSDIFEQIRKNFNFNGGFR